MGVELTKEGTTGIAGVNDISAPIIDVGSLRKEGHRSSGENNCGQ